MRIAMTPGYRQRYICCFPWTKKKTKKNRYFRSIWIQINLKYKRNDILTINFLNYKPAFFFFNHNRHLVPKNIFYIKNINFLNLVGFLPRLLFIFKNLHSTSLVKKNENHTRHKDKLKKFRSNPAISHRKIYVLANWKKLENWKNWGLP